MLSNYPALKRNEVAGALIASVLPALAEAIDNAAQDMAGKRFGDQMSTFDVERLSNDLLHALADYLVLSPVPGRGVHDMLRIHQLQNVAYAADYYEVDLRCLEDDDDASLDDLGNPTPAQILQAAFGDPPPVPATAPKTYVPAYVSAEPVAPTPTVVVDNRPKPSRTLEQIKKEVDARRARNITPIHFLPVDTHADEKRIAEDRSKRAQMRRIEQNVSDTIQFLDKRKEALAEGLQFCDYVHCQSVFKPSDGHHKYCSDQCRSAACRKRKMDAKRDGKQKRLM